MKKILIIRKKVPEKTRKKSHKVGGIGNYYKAIGKYLSGDIHFFDFYANRHNQSIFLFYVFLLSSYVRIMLNLLSFQTKLYVLNTSLDNVGVIRDGFITILFRLFKRRHIIFFHGWHPEAEDRINKRKFSRILFRETFLSASHIIVLSQRFKDKLLSWGYKGRISIETTVVDETLLEGLNGEIVKAKSLLWRKIRILYLGSIIKAKGVYEIVEALALLSGKEREKIEIVIAGDGRELSMLKKVARDRGLNIAFPGYVIGEQKKEILMNSDLFLFASYHEGMPLAVLEAISFGMAILTTPVGGIPDFFQEGEMGFYLKDWQPENIVEQIRLLLNHPETIAKISSFNYQFAKKYFYSSVVAKRIEEIIKSELLGQNLQSTPYGMEKSVEA
jgi:glycosyltransferase involved in cell wall biosynthesis